MGESEEFEPMGLHFFDRPSNRFMCYTSTGPDAGWLWCKEVDRDAPWVKLRLATKEDMKMFDL